MHLRKKAQRSKAVRALQLNLEVFLLPKAFSEGFRLFMSKLFFIATDATKKYTPEAGVVIFTLAGPINK